MAGPGGFVQILGTILSGIKGARDKKRVALDQKNKAKELLNKANSVTTKQATDDPAYKIKAFLAQSGVPGYEQYLEGIDQNMEVRELDYSIMSVVCRVTLTKQKEILALQMIRLLQTKKADSLISEKKCRTGLMISR